MLVVRGGSWVVDKRVVWDVDHTRERPKTGVPYLLFLAPVPKQPGKYMLYATGGFEIKDGRLANPITKRAAGTYEELMAKPYDEVLQTITAVAKQK
jgi:hypothetical protein